MTMATTLMAMFPQAIPARDFVVQDDGAGPYIAFWSAALGKQPTLDQIAAFVIPPPPVTVLSQDIIAQFTPADVAMIRLALDNEIAQAKLDVAVLKTPAAPLNTLWAALQAQKDPMHIANPRFIAGWNGLISVLGQPRMSAIATALNLPSLVV